MQALTVGLKMLTRMHFRKFRHDHFKRETVILPTGSRKSLIFQAFPLVLNHFEGNQSSHQSIAVVISTQSNHHSHNYVNDISIFCIIAMRSQTSNQTCTPHREVGRITGASRHLWLETEPKAKHGGSSVNGSTRLVII